jgi:hypothetical protein
MECKSVLVQAVSRKKDIKGVLGGCGRCGSCIFKVCGNLSFSALEMLVGMLFILLLKGFIGQLPYRLLFWKIPLANVSMHQRATYVQSKFTPAWFFKIHPNIFQNTDVKFPTLIYLILQLIMQVLSLIFHHCGIPSVNCVQKVLSKYAWYIQGAIPEFHFPSPLSSPNNY